MADALCGPANPLQNLRKHTQVDRTLQQDRLVGSRQSPSQGFRTADPRAGSLDADFHAFETAAPNPFQFQQPEFAGAAPAFHPQAAIPGGWAADFQKLNINDHPLPALQFRTEAPLVRSAGGWGNEFMRQRSGASTPVALGKQAVREPTNMSTGAFTNQSSMMYSQPMYSAYSGMYQEGGFEQQQQQQPAPVAADQHAHMSDADFEAAFADALQTAQEMDAQYQPQPIEEHPQDSALPQNESIKIGSDAIQYREWQDRTTDQDTRDADELARTAGQLLDSVQHDTSAKFQNSQFLELMRRIRDREVEVQNNELQSVESMPKDTITGILPGERGKLESQNQMPPDQKQDSHFDFPDMDAVYAPSAVDRSPYTTYGFDDDQYPAFQPQSQTHSLHPGGKWYPEQNPRLRRAEVEMTGAAIDDGSGNGVEGDDGATLEKKISASDFEYVDESAGLARRFVRGEASA